MTDEQIAEFNVEHAKYLHDRINGAYYAAVKKCVLCVKSVMEESVMRDVIVTEMEKELETLYV